MRYSPHYRQSCCAPEPHTREVTALQRRRQLLTSPEVTPPSNSSLLKPYLGSRFIVKASRLEVLLSITSRFPFLRSSSRHSTAPGSASLPSVVCVRVCTRCINHWCASLSGLAHYCTELTYSKLHSQEESSKASPVFYIHQL